MRVLKFIIPLALFAGITWFLLKGLDRDPREIPSPLIGKPAPAVVVPVLGADGREWSPAQMRNQVWVLNVWGSWCAGCKVEHAQLNEWARRGVAPIVGLAWKDAPEASQEWLAKLGNPYAVTVSDRSGRAGIDWGVYGAPETFIIDKAGIVRDKHVGPLTAEVIERRLLPLIAKLKAQ
ncbi:MAG TPA: DsbE family thiol:disulfide interchange protein [Burkholderiaceae bacterium]|jgi:cytochrome c biogenesis protein CcmG/thiol:disulfide interchange protein DsbE|nr:DsbE family thiol:disulfide interchange protein [Burkholderiaceae bacterium]